MRPWLYNTLIAIAASTLAAATFFPLGDHRIGIAILAAITIAALTRIPLNEDD